jgi:Mn2+/Fe2+ NRAMP family transporter
MKKRRLGYILAPVLLVFIIILTVALAGMVMMTKARGIMEDMSIAIIFIVLAVISIVVLYLFLRNITVTKKSRA